MNCSFCACASAGSASADSGGSDGRSADELRQHVISSIDRPAGSMRPAGLAGLLLHGIRAAAPQAADRTIRLGRPQ